jgi:hypothetical protein
MPFRHWILCVLRCKTFENFRDVITAFSKETWTLEQKALFSKIYTPRLAKALGQNEDKGRLMEDMAALCWRVG